MKLSFALALASGLFGTLALTTGIDATDAERGNQLRLHDVFPQSEKKPRRLGGKTGKKKKKDEDTLKDETKVAEEPESEKDEDDKKKKKKEEKKKDKDDSDGDGDAGAGGDDNRVPYPGVGDWWNQPLIQGSELAETWTRVANPNRAGVQVCTGDEDELPEYDMATPRNAGRIKVLQEDVCNSGCQCGSYDPVTKAPNPANTFCCSRSWSPSVYCVEGYMGDCDNDDDRKLRQRYRELTRELAGPPGICISAYKGNKGPVTGAFLNGCDNIRFFDPEDDGPIDVGGGDGDGDEGNLDNRP